MVIHSATRAIHSALHWRLIAPILLGLTALLLRPVYSRDLEPGTLMAQSTTSEQTGLWIDLNIQPEIADWYEAIAWPGDMARADQLHQIAMLKDVAVEPKIVVFKSAALAEQLLPRIADKVQILGYNLEHGPLNPLDEQADPLGSIQRMRTLADRYGMQLALGPDHDFAISHGAQLAPYVDIFIMQVQRVQDQPDVVQEFVVPMAAEVRAANPAILTSIQIRTEGDVEALLDLVRSLRSSIDGVSILTSPQTIDTAKTLLIALRPDAPGPPVHPLSLNMVAPEGLWLGLAIGVVLGLVVTVIGRRLWMRSRH